MSKLKSGLLITARLKSRRLPKKIILEVAGKPLISHMLDRVRLAKQIDKIIICTSTNPQDGPLEKIAREEGIFCYRGSEDDVLVRLREAALEHEINFIVNVTADCPLLDPLFIDMTVEAYKKSNADLIRINNLNLIGQRPIGVKFGALEKVCQIKAESETECWLDYFVKSGFFAVYDLAVNKSLVIPTLKTSIDYPEDYDFIKRLFDELYLPNKVFLLPDIVNLVKRKPELMSINSHCIKLGLENGPNTATPMRLKPDKDTIPLSEPEIRGNEWVYIKECLDSNWVSSVGSYVDRFEKVVAGYLGRKHAVACVNGTAALHIALLVSGISFDDEVLLPAVSFVAPANAVRYSGAWPVFIDVSRDTWQIDPQKVKDFLERECFFKANSLINRKTGREIKAVMPVHILGHPVDMDPILEVAGKYNLKVIADSAESLGALYKEKKVGSLGDICCLSFNGNKIITTGGGGMLLTDNGLIAKKARYLVTQAKDDPVEYIHNEIGYNYRLTNIQAAMGVAQMEKLDEYLNIKTGLARCYEEKLEGICGISPMPNAPWAKPSFWLYTVRVDPAIYGLDSRALMRKLKEENIASRPLWHPLHSLKIFKDCYSYRVEIAEELHREALSLPSSVGLSEIQQDRVVGVIRKNVSGLKTLRRKTRKRCRI